MKIQLKFRITDCRTSLSIIAVVVLSIAVSSCVSQPNVPLNDRREIELNSRIQIDPIRVLEVQPFENYQIQFGPVEDLSGILRVFGEPIKTIRKEIPNKYEKDVIDAGITLEYSGFILQYYFVSLKKIYFPYSLTFTSNERINHLAQIIGTSREGFLRAIRPRKVGASTEKQLTFFLKNGADQINIGFDENDRIKLARVDFYLD